MRLKEIWNHCLARLERQLPARDVETWLRPLRLETRGGQWLLVAPNEFVREQVNARFKSLVGEALDDLKPGSGTVEVVLQTAPQDAGREAKSIAHGLDERFYFHNFVLGQSNVMSHAAARLVAQKPGDPGNNPFLIYGGTGLGKTHLLHAVGHELIAQFPAMRVLYLHSERFVNDMIQALRRDSIERFKQWYRSMDALLIDDIQFFSKKERSQEEFFHTFNALLEGRQQIILTCDRYPKEIEGIEARLRSRFGWGLVVAVEPPDYETRVAILLTKAQERGVNLPLSVAELIATAVKTNVRELEGALNSLAANARFSGRALDVNYAKEALRDLLAVHERTVTLEQIQKTVAGFYQLRVVDILSKRRTRSIARPRQIAMCMAKELTRHSLPEIGDAFGGRDHTTVLHACRTITRLRESDAVLREDYARLIRELTG